MGKRKATGMVVVLFIFCMLLSVVEPAEAASTSKIAFAYSSVSLFVGDTYQQMLKNGKTAIDASKVTWKSSNKNIATVSKAGKVTTKKKGKATITATYKKKTYSYTVTVYSASLSDKTKTLVLSDQSLEFFLEFQSSIKSSNVVWKSSNEKVASITPTKQGCYIKPKSPGTATISVRTKRGTKKLSCKVTVEAPVSDSDDKDNSDKDNPSKDLENNPEINVDPPKKERVLVADPLSSDAGTYQVTESNAYIQDFSAFAQEAFHVGRPELQMDGYNCYSIKNISMEKKPVLEAYVELLCKENYFQIKTNYAQSYTTNSFFSWGLDYTGTAQMPSKRTIQYTSEMADLEIWGSSEFSSFNAYLYIPKRFQLVDLGFRYGKESIAGGEIAGPSAKSGLYQNPDGSFTTSDGRLSASVGHAMVLRDGLKYEAVATYGTNDKEEAYMVNEFYRNEVLYFSAPLLSLAQGDVYTMTDLSGGWTPGSGYGLNAFTHFYHNGLFLGLGRSGEFFTPTYGNGVVKYATVRLMYYKKNAEAVLYYYVEYMDGFQPETVEALAVMSLIKKEDSSEGTDATYTLSAGQSLEITCPTTFHANYNLFTWELLSGSGIVELTGTVAQTCRVKANKPGTARIRVTYNYGIDEPDVLTGIPRNSDKITTHEYLITVTQ